MDHIHRLLGRVRRVRGGRLLRRGGDPWPIYPATSDQVCHPDSTVGRGRGDDPSGKPAVDGSTQQAAQPPAARAEHHILEAEPDSDVGTDVDGVAESRQSSAAPTTATATTLALTTGDRGVGHPQQTGC
jgi:hypothetical protein